MVDLAAWASPAGTYIVAHIDDMLTAGFRTEIDSIKQHLATKFKLKDMEAAKVFDKRVTQFISCPTKRHMIAVRHECRYLKGTVDTRVLPDSTSGHQHQGGAGTRRV